MKDAGILREDWRVASGRRVKVYSLTSNVFEIALVQGKRADLPVPETRGTGKAKQCGLSPKDV